MTKILDLLQEEFREKTEELGDLLASMSEEEKREVTVMGKERIAELPYATMAEMVSNPMVLMDFTLDVTREFLGLRTSRTFWISFAGFDRFHSGVMVEASSERAAVDRSRELGLHPGKGWEAAVVSCLRIPGVELNRSYSEEELMAHGGFQQAGKCYSFPSRPKKKS